MALVSCMKDERDTASVIVQARPLWERTVEGTADENANQSLLTNGKDVILIIADRTITLRGTVRSEQEKISIGALARQYAGAKNIDNQLEVVS